MKAFGDRKEPNVQIAGDLAEARLKEQAGERTFDS